MDTDRLADAVFTHLQTVVMVKKAAIQVALDIADDYPAQASVIIRAVTALSASADALLGDTIVEDPK